MPLFNQPISRLSLYKRPFSLLLAAIFVAACTHKSSNPPLRSASHGPYLHQVKSQLEICKNEKEVLCELGQLGATKIQMSARPAPVHLNIKIDPDIDNVNWFIPHYRVVLETRFDHGSLTAMNCWDADKLESGRYHHLQRHEQIINRIVCLDDGFSWNNVVIDVNPLEYLVKEPETHKEGA